MRTVLIDDFQPWETLYLSAFAERLTAALGGSFERIHPGAAIRCHDPVTWLVTRNWRSVTRQVHLTSKQSVYVSVFDGNEPRASVFGTVWRALAGQLRSQIRLLVHHPMTERYLTEFEQVDSSSVILAPLPYPSFLEMTQSAGSLSVGTLTRLDAAANLNFLMTVAHRLLFANENLIFRVLGDGPLRNHMLQMANALGLGCRFEVIPHFRASDLAGLGAFAYAPIHSDSFLPLMMAVRAGVPAACMQGPGLDEMLASWAIPISPTYDAHHLAKAIESLLCETGARRHYQQALQAGLLERFSWERALSFYGNCFRSSLTRPREGRPVAA